MDPGVLLRVETHRSANPIVPVRFDAKMTSKPSLRRTG